MCREMIHAKGICSKQAPQVTQARTHAFSSPWQRKGSDASKSTRSRSKIFLVQHSPAAPLTMHGTFLESAQTHAKQGHLALFHAIRWLARLPPPATQTAPYQYNISADRNPRYLQAIAAPTAMLPSRRARSGTAVGVRIHRRRTSRITRLGRPP